jgi:hypothetical protein
MRSLARRLLGAVWPTPSANEGGVMSKLVEALVLGSATVIAACTDSVPLDTTLAAGMVNGSAFECTGDWPHSWNPCNYPSSPEAATFASGSDGIVTLRLGRKLVPSPDEGYPTCGGGSSVFLVLDFNTPDDTVLTSANEVTFSGIGDGSILETSDPISGTINPIVLSRDPEGRNAGKFSLTFAWGAIRGTYDTDPPAP